MVTERKYADAKEKNQARRQRKAERKRAYREAMYKGWSRHLPQPIDHALDRWAERFPPDMGFWETYHLSRPVEWSLLAWKVAAAGLRLRLSHESEFRLHDKTGAVFVIGVGHAGVKVVKTVVRIKL